jgi:hypothetical protein
MRCNAGNIMELSEMLIISVHFISVITFITVKFTKLSLHASRVQIATGNKLKPDQRYLI